MANEKRLIWDEDAKRHLIALAVGHHTETLHIDMILNAILHRVPTVDAVEVVHGRWLWDVESHGDPMYGIDEDYGYRCSECNVWADEYGVDGDIYGEPPTHILHYCPNCGSKMDGDGNE